RLHANKVSAVRTTTRRFLSSRSVPQRSTQDHRLWWHRDDVARHDFRRFQQQSLGVVELEAPEPYPLATTLSQGKVLRDMIDRNAPVLSLLPKPKFETSSISALMSIVEHDLGIALLPRLVAIPAATN